MKAHKVHEIDSYKMAYNALRNPDLVQSMYSECEDIMGQVLLTLHGEEHSRRRNMELRLFRRDFLRFYEKEVYPAAVADALKPFVKSGCMDLVEFSYQVNMNLSADLAGIDRINRSASETRQLLGIVRKFSEGATLFHSTRLKEQVCEEVRGELRRFQEVYYEPSRRRRAKLLEELNQGTLAQDALPRDMLMLLLENQLASGMTDDMITREICFFLQAATHSTGNSTVHAFHEITQWCRDNPDDWIRVNSDPVFLQRCVHESLRLHPASPIAWRTAGCPLTATQGVEVDEDDNVQINLDRANKDPEIFGRDAERYNPHRTVIGRYPPYGLTFGVGIHTCFGRDLAGGALPKDNVDPQTHYMGTVTSLVRMLLEYGIHVDPDSPPTRDTNTERDYWGVYPVIFNRSPT